MTTKPKKFFKNYAFIDGQNLYLGIQELGWKLDYKKFYVYLKNKHKVTTAYIFLGFIKNNHPLYNYLKNIGYILIFKPIISDHENLIKGNIDAELVLQTMIDFNSFDQAIIISSDGDFYCLVKHLYTNNKLRALLSPSANKCSSLLKKSAREKMFYLENIKNLLKQK